MTAKSSVLCAGLLLVAMPKIARKSSGGENQIRRRSNVMKSDDNPLFTASHPASLLQAIAQFVAVEYFARRPAMDSGSTEVVFECDRFRLYSDGRVERTGGMDTVPAGFDADTGVTSKGVVIDAATGVTARLYLPTIQTSPSSESDDSATTRLPILVLFHGGYFVVGSPGCPNFHRYANSLVASARVVAVSVDYRLAPEHLLPAAYDDAWAALNWAVSGADPWLSDHGDLRRVFLAGASAGANITHNLAIAAGTSGLHAAAPAPAPARIEGVILLHPSFCGEHKMEGEAEDFWRANKRRWVVIFPGATDGMEDPRINPMAAGAPSLAKLAAERLLVCTASEDPRAPRGRAYCEAVRSSGWRGELEWFESEGETHGFFVPKHGNRAAVALMDLVVAFLARH
uniref:Alpha/beta hydrolase fold-3 domain-containing protein n=1 Tax=Arundo donax TaxID=35708 RepID=A0A0A9E2D5_ARUDO